MPFGTGPGLGRISIRSTLLPYRVVELAKGQLPFLRDGSHFIPGTWFTLLAFAGESKVPWKECAKMDERLRFVARLLEGEKMAPLCREFDISRPTGYKIFERYKDCGLSGLTDRSRRPYRHANQLPFQIEKRIIELKRERPTWGAPKI